MSRQRSPGSQPSKAPLRPAAAVHGVGKCHADEGENGPYSGNEGREEKAQVCKDGQGSDAGEIRRLAVAQYPSNKKAPAGKEKSRPTKKKQDGGQIGAGGRISDHELITNRHQDQARQ